MQPPAKRSNIYLLPGEYFVGDARYRVRTVLGSCVSITLWHRRSKVGAMSHFLLPARRKHSEELNSRYGEEALVLMLRDLALRRIDAKDCEAKIFGGGVMFPSHERDDATNVGYKNGEAAEHLLAIHGISIISESLYGKGHREVIFDIATGDAWSRQIDPAEVHKLHTKAIRK